MPIDGALKGVCSALGARGALVLVAEPGAGKTTRVPPALMGMHAEGEVLVLQPRRVAARMAARRVASELGEAVGERIGYQVRFEDVGGPRTRVRFITEALLTRRLLRDPQLRGVVAVVLDEFHERSIHADIALALLRRLQRGKRPDLQVLVMSATLMAQPVADFLGCEVQHVAGRTFPVHVTHAALPSEKRLEAQVAAAFAEVVREGAGGDVLVFLPGAGEIRRAQAACEATCKRAGYELHLLHGDLPAKAQDRAVSPGPRPKLILSTNIAETSLTIEGVTTVIDSGLARVAGHSPFSGLPTLALRPISQASATQRAGRAGRVREGRCVRLYTQHDFQSRPSHDVPELARADLAETALFLAALGHTPAADQWLQAPPDNAYDSALSLLRMLGAIEGGTGGETPTLTALGKRLAGMPLHPRLGRIVVEAEARGLGEEGCLLAAMLSERDVSLAGRTRFDGPQKAAHSGPCDLLQRMDAVQSAEATGGGAGAARNHDLDAGTLRAVLQTRDRLRRLLRNDAPAGGGGGDAPTGGGSDADLQMAVLAGFGDRVAQRRGPGSDQLVFAFGGSATQAPTSVVREAQLLVVVDAAEQGGARRGVTARRCTALEAEWLLELFPDSVREYSDTRFDADSEVIETTSGLAYGSVVLDQSVRRDVGGEAVSATLAQAAHEHGLAKLFDLDAAESVLRRWRFAAGADPAMPACPEDALARAVVGACVGGRSFADLRRADIAAQLTALLPGEAQARMQRVAPGSVALPGGRRLAVNYEADRPPWVQSRLQDFFGLATGPMLGNTPLTLHLLAPNRRAVQVTQDLAGFWQRHYPEQRRVLMRRYPRHDWPEDPLTATPPAPRPPRPPRKPRAGGKRKK